MRINNTPLNGMIQQLGLIGNVKIQYYLIEILDYISSKINLLALSLHSLKAFK